MHAAVPMMEKENLYVITVAPQICQSFTVIWHVDPVNFPITGKMVAYPNTCKLNQVLKIYDKKCNQDPAPVNLKVISDELDELHLEVKCPEASIITIYLGLQNYNQNLANVSIVEGLLSRTF
jgi:hypothetical protein